MKRFEQTLKETKNGFVTVSGNVEYMASWGLRVQACRAVMK